MMSVARQARTSGCHCEEFYDEAIEDAANSLDWLTFGRLRPAPLAMTRDASGLLDAFPRPLAPAPHPPHIMKMIFKARIAALRQSPAVRLAAFILGCVMMIAAPLAGLLPGPGGIFLFAIGLGLALRSSIWAKRRYVALKRKQPKLGGWADWGLRRASAKRRGERAKRKEGKGSN